MRRDREAIWWNYHYFILVIAVVSCVWKWYRLTLYIPFRSLTLKRNILLWERKKKRYLVNPPLFHSCYSCGPLYLEMTSRNTYVRRYRPSFSLTLKVLVCWDIWNIHSMRREREACCWTHHYFTLVIAVDPCIWKWYRLTSELEVYKLILSLTVKVLLC